MSMNADIARGIDGAVECRFTEVSEVVCQQIVGDDIQVIRKTSEMLVMDAARDDSLMSVAIDNHHVS